MANVEEHIPGRPLPMEVSNLIVRLFSEYTGRGPNKARTIIRDNLIICVTHGNMTKGERRLVQEGGGAMGAAVRRKFQTTMQDDLIGGIELLTGRKVVSFLSDHNADTDHAAEIFVLDGSTDGPSDGD